MKTYEVTRSSSGQIGVLVKTDRTNRNATLLQHCVLHSPTGMETGYAGSGPADLAASILADYLCVSPEHLSNVWRKSWSGTGSLATKVIKLHQSFKEDFIAPKKLAAGESYEITGDDIAGWLLVNPE
jgi:hypothetical protein